MKLFHGLFGDKHEFSIVFRLSSVFLFAFLLYLTANYFLVYYLSVKDIENYLTKTTTNVVSDFQYADGKWNTDKYLSDISTPTEIPLYIYTTDGFLMDRYNTIHGLLDTSNHEYASSFTQPTTITSPAGETWRVLSKPITRSGQVMGTVFAGYFDPKGLPQKEIDAKLQETVIKLDSDMGIVDGHLDVTNVRQKEVEANISFEIVDKYNRSLLSIGGPPSYIDKSYVQDALGSKGYRAIKDSKTGMPFLVYSQPIVSGGSPVGVVVTARSLEQLYKTLGYQLWFSVVAGVLAIVVFMLVVVFIYRHDVSNIVQERLNHLANPAPPDITSISFDQEKGNIIVNKDILIAIPPDSHQFDICKLLFRSPTKNMDTLDLAEAIGDQEASDNVRRMVYDSVLSINEKVRRVLRVQLVTRKNHQYRINPELASKIRK